MMETATSSIHLKSNPKLPGGNIPTPVPYPYPPSALLLNDLWDDRHVKMPYSKRNGDGNDWQTIESQLREEFHSEKQLSESIKKYNKNYKNVKFDVLEQFFENYPWKEYEEIINFMAQLALALPHLVTQSVPMLLQNDNAILMISQQQIACLLSNAFFCTFPRRTWHNAEYKSYTPINFLSLFTIDKKASELSIKVEKLRCIFNYFKRIMNGTPDGVVTFERRSHKHNVDWDRNDSLLNGLDIREGNIESDGFTAINFANKYIGGGVLTSGCVQEELMFLVCPELIVSRLFTEVLTDSETLVITGCQRYNNISGYSYGFQFGGDLHETGLIKDQWGRYCTQIVAMDAVEYKLKNDPNQYEKSAVLRNLKKAYCGFYDSNQYSSTVKPAIASGKWGCGVFNGDPQLVYLLQLLAASQADRNLILYVQNDRNFKSECEQFYQFALNNNLTIKDIYKSILDYSKSNKAGNLFQFIHESICEQNKLE